MIFCFKAVKKQGNKGALKVMRGWIDSKCHHVRICNVSLSGCSNSRAAEANIGSSHGRKYLF